MPLRSRRAACTIIAKNYLAHARVLAHSFREHNPDAEMFVLVVDDIAGYVDPTREPFTLLQLVDIPLENRASLCFKYNVLELCTAVKPFLMQHLFDEARAERILYLDPDILVLDTLAPLYDLAGSHSVVLIPHITDPIEDDALPNETTFLQCGVYNLGFLGLSDTPVTRRMLAWWQKRCAEFCIVRLEDGLFVDQKWMDLVPVLFNDAAIVTERGYNVAYWNLHGRKITHDGGRWIVNGENLRFFHFSGYDPHLPDTLSKHQTRYSLRQLGEVAGLFERYRTLLLEAGARHAMQWPYSFSRFDNGAAVSPIMRDVFYRLGPQRLEFGNPFLTASPNSFFQWLSAPAANEQQTRPYISNLAAHIVNYRQDIKEAFPDFRGRQRQTFMEWVRSTGRRQLDLDPRLLTPLTPPQDDREEHAPPSVREVARVFPGASCRLCSLVALLDRYGYGGRLRSLLQQMFRREAPPSPTAEAAEGSANPPLPTPSPSSPQPRSRSLRLIAAIIQRTLRPCARHHLVRNLVTLDAPALLPGLSEVPRAGSAGTSKPFGLNLTGYLTTESGVGEAARLMALAARAVDLPHVLVNFEVSYNLRRSDRAFTDFSTTNPYAINLIHVNADQVPVFSRQYGTDFFKNRYSIGFWMWELAEFPDEWHDRFAWFDEIWTPSSFTTRAIARRSPVPVSTVPLPIPRHHGTRYGRSHFGLPEDRFVFLFVFDFASVFERKNPLALVEAFKRAFGHGDDTVLVMKCSNADADPENAARLREAARHDRVRLIEHYIFRDEVTSLIGACDAYVSLHRSEGFGLTMAEAMSAGRTVIATGYSGNMEFMNAGNSFLVRHRLVQTTQDHGPYRKGTVWADPDIDHAAELMRWVFEHRPVSARVAAHGSESVARALGLDVIGRAVQVRLEDAWRRRDGHGT